MKIENLIIPHRVNGLPGMQQELCETAVGHNPMGKSHLIPLQLSTSLLADSFSADLKFLSFCL